MRFLDASVLRCDIEDNERAADFVFAGAILCEREKTHTGGS